MYVHSEGGSPASGRVAEKSTLRTRLAVIDGGSANPTVPRSARRAAWDAAADKLWSSWCELPEWEIWADDSFGDLLGEEVLVLWAISRFRTVDGALNELIDEDLRPRFADALLEDLVRVAFALGAGWASDCASRDGDLEPPEGRSAPRRPRRL